MRTTIAIIVIAIIGIVAIFSLRLHKERSAYNELKARYVALHGAKTKTDTIFFRDTVRIFSTPEIIRKALIDSIVVVDTIYTVQPLMDRRYAGKVVQENVQIDYNFLVRGWLLDYNFTPVFETQELRTQHIVAQPITAPIRGVSFGGGVGFPTGMFLSGTYRQGRFSYSGTFFRARENYFLIGVEYHF